MVLHSLGIPYEIVRDELRCLLIVPNRVFEKAKYELWQYETENRRPRLAEPAIKVDYQNGLPGVVTYVLIVSLVAWLAGEASFGRDWFGAGRIDGNAIRGGEWWRAITALTLHSGLGHLIGNIGFGILFGMLAGTLAGPGVAWLIILLAATTGNLLNTLLLDSTHRAIGASTAVFAALGLVAGFSWRAKLMSQERWPYRLGPIVGGIALLAYTGTGDDNTDIGAHLSGFLCGFAAGIVLPKFARLLPERNIQRLSGAAALSLVILAWLTALEVWA